MKLLAFIALLMLCCNTFAAVDYPAGMRLFGYYAVPEGKSFSVYNFTHNNETTYAIVSGEEVYAVLLEDFPHVMPYAMADEGELYPALEAYYLSTGKSAEAANQFPSIHQGILSIADIHRQGETKCRVLTGTDRTECTSFETCQKACYSVTSFCLPIALGSGRVFINYIWEFENDSIALDKAYENEKTAYSLLEEDFTSQNMEDYVLSLEEINRAATKASSSPLFYGYSFCFSPDYSLSIITNLQLTAQKAYKSASPFYSLNETAKLVKNRTLEGIGRKEQYEIPEELIEPVSGPEEKEPEEQITEEEKEQEYASNLMTVFAAAVIGLLIIGAGLFAYVALVKKKPGAKKKSSPEQMPETEKRGLAPLKKKPGARKK